MDKKVLLIGNINSFSSHVEACLKEDAFCIEQKNSVEIPDDTDTVIMNFMDYKETLHHELNIVLTSGVKKVIILENALDLYLNSHNGIPFSVYSKMTPKNETCERLLDVERRVKESGKKFVIFRISEIYGQSMPESMVSKLLFASFRELENSCRDFIYDGDVIQAIEIALKKDVSGLFDIASGETTELKRLVELIKVLRQESLNIQWSRKRLHIAFNCENFKFYKWVPLVNIELGVKTIYSLMRRNYV